MRTQLKHRGIVIESDGITVWVNTGLGCVGRFGRAGIDVHRSPEEQHDGGECLHCTHEFTTAADWPIFVAKMKEHHNVDVPEKHKPNRFKEQRK